MRGPPTTEGPSEPGSARRCAVRRPNERWPASREAASYGAYRALADLFPSRIADFDALMGALGYDPGNISTDVTTPAGIGNTAAAALLEYRHRDGSNQLGDLAPGAYGAWTGYAPVNSPDVLVDPSRWQPLRLPNGTVQRFAVAHWGQVKRFALPSGSVFRAPPPPPFASAEHLVEVDQLIAFSVGLNDRTKAIAEYWSDGPRSEQPPGHWCLFAQWVSKRDGNSLDTDVKLFFALANAQFDASIAAWDTKRYYENERPVPAGSSLAGGDAVGRRHPVLADVLRRRRRGGPVPPLRRHPLRGRRSRRPDDGAEGRSRSDRQGACIHPRRCTNRLSPRPPMPIGHLLVAGWSRPICPDASLTRSMPF